MDLILYRQYFPNGTNGKLYNGTAFLCETIELPWRDNKRNISCIPTGRYVIRERNHLQKGLQLEIANVPMRESILFHPANTALRELRGCIAPVKKCTGEGEGEYSKAALKMVEMVIRGGWEKGEKVFLVIREGS